MKQKIAATEPVEKYTHKGWFFLCPIYVGGIDGPQVFTGPRWECWLGRFWLDTQEAVFAILVCALSLLLGPSYEPVYPIYLTGALDA